MKEDEELHQLRAEKHIMRELLQRKDEELHQLRQANQDLREGLKQAMQALGRKQEQITTLEGVVTSQQERIKTTGKTTSER